jgi:hypothetical protein
METPHKEHIVEMMQKCYELADTVLSGPQQWLLEFAGECLEQALFEQDACSSPEQLLKKVMEEYMSSRKLEQEDH